MPDDDDMIMAKLERIEEVCLVDDPITSFKGA